ncbi:MAG: metal ABC transporter substrate-binding protein [Phycisphaeraceae bacterium]
MQQDKTNRHGVLLLACLLLASGPFFAGCGSEPDSGMFEDDGRVKVLATTTMIADAARVIAGDDAQVVGVMREGEDPHTFKVAPKHGSAVLEADLVLANGLHLESTFDKILKDKGEGKTVYLAEQASIKPISDAGAEGAPDPHCWMDVVLFKRYAEGIRDALIEADPGNEAGYRERAEAYLKELDELDAWVRSQFERVPAERRVIITSHDAFNYFGRAYGIEVHGVVGISTEQQATSRDVQRLEQLIRDRGIRAVFYETSVTNNLNKLIEQIAEETGVAVGGELFSDSLGKRGEPGGTYIGMIRHNTTTMVEALE